MLRMPHLSVITVCLNAAQVLPRTIDSLVAQPDRSRIEHIIIDGGSTDGSIELLARYGNRIHWISEPDRGIYDAMNKGIRMARGRGLLFLNAGDWLEGEVLTADLPVPCFLPVRYSHPVFGDRDLRLKTREWGLPNCHQGIVFDNRPEILYDLRFRVAADLDYYLRHGYGDRLPMHACSGRVHYDNRGFSVKNARRRDREIAEILRENFGVIVATRFALTAWFKRMVRELAA